MDGDIGHCRYSKLGSGACENQVTPKTTSYTWDVRAKQFNYDRGNNSWD